MELNGMELLIEEIQTLIDDNYSKWLFYEIRNMFAPPPLTSLFEAARCELCCTLRWFCDVDVCPLGA